MRKRIALLIVVSMLFGIIFGTNAATANAAEAHEYTDQYDSDTMLGRYSTAEIVAMYPEFSEHLARELRALRTDIDVRDYSFTKENIGAVFFSVICENPDIFYVFPTSFETTASVASGEIISIRPEYFFDAEDVPAHIKKFEKMANSILAGVNMSWNDVTKARYLHDALAHYTEYDTKYETISSADYERYRIQMRIYTAYGALVDNNAVCEGYSMAYKYLLSKVGVKAYYIQSVKKRHAWNMIEINGKVYHVDIAHDDPTYDNLGRVNHTSFMKSDSYIKNDGDSEHTDWVTNLKASDTSYDNAWWNDICTMIYRYGDYDYYIDQKYTSSIYSALTRRDISTGTTEALKVLKTRWNVKGMSNTFWDRAFTYLTSDGTYLYFNDTNSVYRRKIDSGATEKVYTKPSTVSNDIYGLAFRLNGNLYATIKENPNATDIFYKLNITAEPVTEPSSSQTDPNNPTNPSQNVTSATEPITAATTKPVKVKPVTVKRKITIYLRQTVTLTLTPKASYKYSTSNKKVATVTSKGTIKGKKAGKVIITAKSSKAIFKLTVTVKKPRLNYTKKTLKRKKSFKLKVIGGSGKITLKNSNGKVIKVKSSGKVIAKKKGKATITVKVCGLTLKCKITVK